MSIKTVTHKLIVALLTTLMLIQPSVHAAPMLHAEHDFSVYLPLIYKPPLPQFVINSPAENSTISGMNFFSIQPIGDNHIDRVTFQAGSTTVGGDNDGSDGFKIFLNAADLPSGQTQLRAIASGPGGEAVQTIDVTVASAPPQTAIIDETGGTLASEIGSVISLLPDSVPAGTTVTVDELTQEETVELHGIDWEDLGVTFLGAQSVESDAQLSQPLGMIASAGFGNRVQPGQAVVNYQLMPDSDGDGVAEIVVVNTASVAPNGDVLSDPIKSITVREITSNRGTHQVMSSSLSQSADRLGGAPGETIQMNVEGFNLFSAAGNVALFKSQVDDTEVIMIGDVDIDPANNRRQLFRVVIPYLPAGVTTLTLKNSSSGSSFGPLEITVDPLPELTRSRADIFDDYFDRQASLVAQLRELIAEDEQLEGFLSGMLKSMEGDQVAARAAWDEIEAELAAGGIPEFERFLDDAAKMIEVSGTLTDQRVHQRMGVSRRITQDDDCIPPEVDVRDVAKSVKGIFDSLLGLTSGGGEFVSLTNHAAAGNTTGPLRDGARKAADMYIDENIDIPLKNRLDKVTGFANQLISYLSVMKAYSDLFRPVVDAMEYVRNFAAGNCDDTPEPGPNRPNPPIPAPPRRRGPTTGMGSATPPGGNGFGNTSGSGRSRLAVLRSQASPDQQAALSQVAIKVLVNSQPTPFTGLADAGGYFFVPFIPAGEPFAAVAVDRTTRETRTINGVGPTAGESTFLFFDFFTPEAVEYTLHWDGGGDGTSWHDPLNWSLDRIPAVGDKVAITTTDTSLVVHDAAENTGIVSLFSTVPISWAQGSLTVLANSSIDAPFQMAGDTDLIASGLGASFTVNGKATLKGASLFALEGGQIRIPQESVYDGDASSDEPEIVADGANSRLDLSGVTQMSGNTKRCCFGFGMRYVKIDATNGGEIDLSGVQAIETGRIRLVLEGAENQVDFSGLRQLGGGSLVEVINQGGLRLGQLERFTESSLVVDNASLDLASLSNADASIFTVRNGSQVVLPKLTSYSGTGRPTLNEWQVRGPGSLLDLSATTAITGNTFINATLSVIVSEGGQFDLSNVETISTGNIVFKAAGSDSKIDLSSLTHFASPVLGDAGLESGDQGQIVAPNLTSLAGTYIRLASDYRIETSQVVSVAGGRIVVVGTEPDFSNLENVDGTNIFVSDGGKLALPKVDRYAGDGGGFFGELQATGPDSVLDLSTVKTLTGNTFVNDHLSVKAAEGGKVDLSQVPEVTVGMVQFVADGENSLIDLSALTKFTRESTGVSSLEASNGGTIQAPVLTEVSEVDIVAESGVILMP